MNNKLLVELFNENSSKDAILNLLIDNLAMQENLKTILLSKMYPEDISRKEANLLFDEAFLEERRIILLNLAEKYNLNSVYLNDYIKKMNLDN